METALITFTKLLKIGEGCKAQTKPARVDALRRPDSIRKAIRQPTGCPQADS